MAKDLEKPTESSEQKAKRRWRNQKIRQDYKAGNTPVPMMVNPKDIDYVNKKVHLDQNPPPEVGTVLENKAKRRPGGFERKFLKEIRGILEERKQQNLELIRASIAHQKKILTLEKIRRLELEIAREEKRIADKQNAQNQRIYLRNCT
jgi:hypothetical protein